MTTLEASNLSDTIERLVVFGGVSASPELEAWLLACGIARPAPRQTEWLVPTLPYLESVLPADDRQDLFRRTVIRDPQYRLHLDLALARVLQIIAKSERWTRFEELAFGVLSPISQRLLSLLEWVASQSGLPPNGLCDVHWDQFEFEVCGDASAHFKRFDDHLWGHARDAAELFPLIEDLYLPLVGQSVHFELSDQKAQVMTSLIEAARLDDGIELSGDELVLFEELRRSGAPVLCRPGTRLCSLVGRVELSLIEPVAALSSSMRSVPLGVPALARRSELHIVADGISWLKETGAMNLTGHATFLSICPASGKWPDLSDKEVPPWANLPGSDTLSEAALLKRTPGLEDAVIALDGHPLYGLLLQFLISEALDRELGDETLLLAPPLDKVGPETEWGTSVLYRPSSKAETGSASESIGYLGLGTLDEVMDRIALQLSTAVVPLPYSIPDYGLWSWGLHLLIDLKVVVGQRDRWALSSTLHDRLYTGNLMARVLRDRRDVRQTIHRVLHGMWKETAASMTDSNTGRGESS